MKVEGLDVIVDEYVGRLTHDQAYELAYELLQKARQAWPYYVKKPKNGYNETCEIPRMLTISGCRKAK